MFWNPAATTRLEGNSFLGGGALISLKGSFTRDTSGRKYDSDVPTQPPPHLFFNHKTKGSQWSYGAGFYYPYGLTSQWGTDFPGRFESQKASLHTFYIQPNVAYQINDK